MQFLWNLDGILQPVPCFLFLEYQVPLRMLQLSGNMNKGALFRIFIFYIINIGAQQLICPVGFFYDGQIQQ